MLRTKPTSARPSDDPYPAIATELARTIKAREDAFPRMVAKGNMTQRDATNGIHIARAWAEDCARYAAAESERVNPRDLCRDGTRFPAAALRAFPWVTRWRAVQTELDDRARAYPAQIARGNLTQSDADQRMERLTAMLHLYDGMADWQPSNGIRPRGPGDNRTPTNTPALMKLPPPVRHHAAPPLDHPDQARIHFPDHAPAEQKEMFA
jgi:hypothetical protein